jgi:hypothetical protein
MPYANREDHRKNQRERLKKNRSEWLAKNGPCKRCGTWENLEVDHIDRTTKVDHRIWSWSEKRRQEELKKCQVLCFTCHLEKSREAGDRPPAMGHGNRAMYETKGCRCADCRKAHTDYQTVWRKNKKKI